ncbi:MAG: HAD-IIA family hydrolase [Verrucomicrobium sp.]|nr:HAD-IIA family hydrolase [Verrucomicrobium sp.]
MNTPQNAYLLDMDGVIYRENQLIPGAADLVALFQEKGIPFLFLTNNSAPTPDELAIKLKHLGIKDLYPRHFYTSALNTADFLWETHPNCTAYVLGEGGLIGALQEAKIPNDAIAPHYVVVGEGFPPMDKIVKAHELIEKGARLVVTNPDCWCPVASDKTRPGAGALAAYLETSTGQRPYYLGKPNPYMFSRARKRLLQGQGHADWNVIMVGDTMETDIRGAVEIGMQAYLVLTGSTSLGEMGDYVYQPTRVLESVADLLQEVATGEQSDRLSSPAFQLPEKGTETVHRKKRYATA